MRGVPARGSVLQLLSSIEAGGVTECIMGPRAFPTVKGKEHPRTSMTLDGMEGRRIGGSRNPLLNRGGPMKTRSSTARCQRGQRNR
ncbi:uncharacterized protein BDZ99DRAFT_178876 [Mytilinidion resinicola]|uniref:Uncharacterized protein n=1 Tax=Mytilinidion resinicola TaxID=574789 RepID=A0A6A6Y2F1_9PEZI|nr:uncharacterized protein BDZ99DRAFT_178876 [Mytilinidion resinicola]KAF2802996.1 hypothetical protein BDZ99DRAFT_178876 [Mytilinidion resinicola]